MCVHFELLEVKQNLNPCVVCGLLLYCYLHRKTLLVNVCLYERTHMSYHGQRHAVYLMFVFGLVLPEGAVPARERGETGDE